MINTQDYQWMLQLKTGLQYIYYNNSYYQATKTLLVL
jgi:hypothetical protein